MRELKDLLPALPASMKRELAAALRWRRSVGAELSRQLRVQRVARGTLFVEASDSKWVHAVLPSLGSRWRAQPGGTDIKRVRFLIEGHTVEEVVLSYEPSKDAAEARTSSNPSASPDHEVLTHRSLSRPTVPLGDRREEAARRRPGQHGWSKRLQKIGDAFEEREKS